MLVRIEGREAVEVEGLRKKKREREKTHWHGQQYADCGGGERWVEMEEGIRRIKGDEKYKIKWKTNFLNFPFFIFLPLEAYNGVRVPPWYTYFRERVELKFGWSLRS